MDLKHITILLTIALAPTLSQRILPDALKSILQDMLLPRTTGQAIQFMTSAAGKKMGLPNLPTVKRRFAISDTVPRTVVRNGAVPNEVIMRRPNDMAPRKNIIIQKSNNQIVVPKNMVIQRANERVLTKQVIVNGNDGTQKKILVRKGNDLPKRVIVKNGNDFTFRVPPQMRPTEVVQQKVLVNQPNVAEFVTLPQQKLYGCAANPSLPAASPVSAMASLTSNDLPPAIPQSRGQFLRKIPIPPPTV